MTIFNIGDLITWKAGKVRKNWVVGQVVRSDSQSVSVNKLRKDKTYSHVTISIGSWQEPRKL